LIRRVRGRWSRRWLGSSRADGWGGRCGRLISGHLGSSRVISSHLGGHFGSSLVTSGPFGGHFWSLLVTSGHLCHLCHLWSPLLTLGPSLSAASRCGAPQSRRGYSTPATTAHNEHLSSGSPVASSGRATRREPPDAAAAARAGRRLPSGCRPPPPRPRLSSNLPAGRAARGGWRGAAAGGASGCERGRLWTRQL